MAARETNKSCDQWFISRVNHHNDPACVCARAICAISDGRIYYVIIKHTILRAMHDGTYKMETLERLVLVDVIVAWQHKTEINYLENTSCKFPINCVEQHPFAVRMPLTKWTLLCQSQRPHVYLWLQSSLSTDRPTAINVSMLK